MNTAESAAHATANWWADHVFGGTVASNGDGLGTALSIIAGVQGRPAPSSKREAFVEALVRRVDAALLRDGAEKYGISLDVDYGPEGMLARVAQEVGVSGFPWKTHTTTYSDYVTGSVGYGGRTSIIWQSESWERPVCGQGQWDLSKPRGGRLPWKCSGLRFHDEEHTFDVPDPLCDGFIGAIDGGYKPCQNPESHYYHREPGRNAHDFVAKAEAS